MLEVERTQGNASAGAGKISKVPKTRGARLRTGPYKPRGGVRRTRMEIDF